MFHTRPARKLRPIRPHLEALECRHLPSTYVVDRLTDTGAGSGMVGDFRYCLTQTDDGDVITFDVTGTIDVSARPLTLTHSITIEGPGPGRLTIYGFGHPGVLSVDPGPTVRISGLTVHAVSCGIFNRGGLSLDHLTIDGRGEGTGIYNEGDLSLNDCTISDCADSGIDNDGSMTISNSTISGNHSGVYGGGIDNFGSLTISDSTISGNTAFTPDGFHAQYGGGIANEEGTMVITNCTIAGNAALGDGYGGGVYNTATLTVSNSTISGNTAHGFSSGSGIDNSGTLNMWNTILAGNAGYDLFGDLTSGMHNLVDDDPQLGPLQDNGGPTKTMALLPGSPALNAGDPAQLGVADQRGVVRSGGVNIGAYQASASAFVLTAPTPATAGVPFDLTVIVVDSFGQIAAGYTGTVTCTTDDPDGSVPADYTFTAADAGSHTFEGGVTLYADGSRITVQDTEVDTLTGSIVIPLG